MAEYLVTLSLLIVIVLVVRGLFRRSVSPTVMYALWLVVVLRLCLPFPLFRVEMDLPAWQETIPQEDYGQQGAADPGIDPDTVTPPAADTPSVPDTPPVIIPTTPSIPSHPSVPTVPSVPENPTVPGENPVPDIPDVPVTPEVPVTPPASIDWMRVAFTVWISGSAILALWFAITGIVYHYRLITHRTLYKTLRKTKVYLTEDESAPCLAGVIPSIYIPPVEMDDDARAFIVLHEYMHLRHGDHVWAVVRIIALIAHWWNPLVWAAVILSKRDAELACDHAVASQLNRENRLEYARILLDTIPQKHRYAVGLGSAPMKERILRLTKTQKNRILCVVLAVIITAAAVGCSFIGLKDREDIDTLGDETTPSESEDTNNNDLLEALDYSFLMKDDSERVSLLYSANEQNSDFAEHFCVTMGVYKAYIVPQMPAWLRDTWEPQLYCIDIELPGMPKDGIEDAIVILTTGTGTGVHTEEAYVLSGADGTLHSFPEPYTVIENAVSRDDNGKTWIVDASGKRIDLPDNAYFDQHYKFYIEDGCLYAKVSIGYGMLQYLENYFCLQYGESGVIWEYAGGEEPRSQGPFVGYVADKTTPWIDLYTEKNGTYVGRIPYEIFHDWIATDRDKDTWTPGWMGEYVCFYYAEFGNSCWAAAHLRDTVLGSGRKNVATSADGGKTWDIGSTRDNYGGNHVVGMGFATDKIAFISCDPYNEHDGADGPVISRTTDGGKTWELLDITVPDSLKGQKLISGIPFYDGDLLRYSVWLNPSHGRKEGEPMYLISRDKGLTWEWDSIHTGTASLSGVLSCILRGEDAFHDTATKQRAYLTDWLKTNEMSVSKYSVIDLNGDGVPELVLWLNRGTNEHVGFLVLYDINNTVYAHLLYYREFSDLKEDGTFDFSSGVSNHGIGRIDFEGDTYTIRKLAYCESVDNQNVSYFLENKSVTKQAFDAYENAQNSKTDAVWVEHTIEAAPGYKQYTPAIDIDTAKLDYVKPMAMYGESQPQANYNRTANIYPGIGSEGYADGVGYITFGICNDRKSPDYVSRYYTYRVTSEGGYIISVDEVETITRDMVLKNGKPYTGSLEGQHVCVVNNRYYGITISGNTISALVGLYQTDAGGTGKGTYTYDPKTGEMTVTTITKYHDGNGNILVNSPKTVTGKLYEYNDMVHFLYDDAKATPLPLSFPKINAFPPDRTDFIFDDLAGGWYHSFRDEKGDQFYCLALDPETQQICFAHGFYDGSYAARYAGTYRVDYNRIIHATLQDNNDPSAGEMKFVFSMGYSMGRDETGEMRTTINITPQVCDMENYRDMLGRYFGFQREKFTTEELDEREEHYNFVMTAYEKAAEAAVTFYTAGSVDTTDSVWVDEETYFRVKGFDTPNDLRLYMESHFAPALIDQFLTGEDAAKYIQHEGKLYATPGILPESPRLGKRYYSASKVTEDWYAVEVTVEVLDTKDLSTVLAYQSFQFDYQYKNDKWVFIQFPHIQ